MKLVFIVNEFKMETENLSSKITLFPKKPSLVYSFCLQVDSVEIHISMPKKIRAIEISVECNKKTTITVNGIKKVRIKKRRKKRKSIKLRLLKVSL